MAKTIICSLIFLVFLSFGTLARSEQSFIAEVPDNDIGHEVEFGNSQIDTQIVSTEPWREEKVFDNLKPSLDEKAYSRSTLTLPNGQRFELQPEPENDVQKENFVKLLVEE